MEWTGQHWRWDPQLALREALQLSRCPHGLSCAKPLTETHGPGNGHPAPVSGAPRAGSWSTPRRWVEQLAASLEHVEAPAGTPRAARRSTSRPLVKQLALPAGAPRTARRSTSRPSVNHLAPPIGEPRAARQRASRRLRTHLHPHPEHLPPLFPPPRPALRLPSDPVLKGRQQ